MTPAAVVNELTLPEEKTFEMLNAAAKETGSDSFMVRVFRRKGVTSTGLGENLAIFAEATLEQIGQPEPWMQRLAGGGQYTMQVAHMSATTKRIGGLLRFQIPGESRPVDPTAVHAQGWEGPRYLTFPVPGNGVAVPPAPAGQPRWGWPTDPTQGGAFMPIGFQQTQQAPGIAADGVFVREQAALERIRAAEKALADKEAALQKQMIEREENVRRADLEARMRAENERVRAEAAQHAARLEQQMEQMKALLQQPKKDTSLAETVTAIAAVITPLATQMMTSSAQAREASERRAAEQAAQTQQLITQLLTKKEGLPPEVTMLFEMQKNQSTGNAEMMTRIVDAMGAVSKSSVQMIEVMADLSGGGPEEPPAIQMVREAMKGIAMLANGAKDGAKKQIQTQQTQQAQQRLPQQPNGQPQNNNAPGSHAVPQNGQNGHSQQPSQSFGGTGPAANNAVATGPQKPTQPAQPPPNGLAEPARSSVDEMERLIRNRYEPVENVAAFFVKAVQAPEPNAMRAALREHDGEIGDLMEARLGNWINEAPQNMAYISRLAEAVDTAGTEAGIYGPGPSEEPEVFDATPAPAPTAG